MRRRSRQSSSQHSAVSTQHSAVSIQHSATTSWECRADLLARSFRVPDYGRSATRLGGQLAEVLLHSETGIWPRSAKLLAASKW
jgi:hypothetical protein